MVTIRNGKKEIKVKNFRTTFLELTLRPFNPQKQTKYNRDRIEYRVLSTKIDLEENTPRRKITKQK